MDAERRRRNAKRQTDRTKRNRKRQEAISDEQRAAERHRVEQIKHLVTLTGLTDLPVLQLNGRKAKIVRYDKQTQFYKVKLGFTTAQNNVILSDKVTFNSIGEMFIEVKSENMMREMS